MIRKIYEFGNLAILYLNYSNVFYIVSEMQNSKKGKLIKAKVMSYDVGI